MIRVGCTDFSPSSAPMSGWGAVEYERNLIELRTGSIHRGTYCMDRSITVVNAGTGSKHDICHTSNSATVRKTT